MILFWHFKWSTSAVMSTMISFILMTETQKWCILPRANQKKSFFIDFPMILIICSFGISNIQLKHKVFSIKCSKVFFRKWTRVFLRVPTSEYMLWSAGHFWGHVPARDMYVILSLLTCTWLWNTPFKLCCVCWDFELKRRTCFFLTFFYF